MWLFKKKKSEYPDPKKIQENWCSHLEKLEKRRTCKDEHQLFEWSVENGKYYLCPDCEGKLLEGPSGGLSTNMICESCGHKFNLTPPMYSLARI